METLFYFHTKMHHGIYLLSVLSVVMALIAMVRKQAIAGIGMWIIRIYSIVLTLQVTVGLLQLAMRWSDLGDGLRHRLEHGTLMLVALTMVHMTPRFMRRADSVGARNTLLMLIGSLALVMLGVSLIQRAKAGV